MHRKIKTKNRKKLKPVDPFNVNKIYQAKDLQKNQPPKDYEQEIPRSFRNLFMNPENDVETLAKKTKKKKRNPNMIEGYERKSWETDKQFLNRVQRSTYDYVNEQMTKIKFGLVGFEPTDILNINDKKKRRHGEGDNEKKTDEPKKKKKKRKIEKDELEANDQKNNNSSQSTKSVKKKEKNKNQLEKKRRKKRKMEDEADPLYLREVIPFGERVDEPPRLSIPKKANKVQPSKAGAKDLLLKRALDGSEPIVDRSRRYENDGTIKCDDLAKQRVLEEERARVIEAYRNQKKILNKKKVKDP